VNLCKVYDDGITAISYKQTQLAVQSERFHIRRSACKHTHTHTHPCNGPLSGLPRWAGTRKVKPIWILLKQETVSGSVINWAICKSAPHSRQITTSAPDHSVFLHALPAAEPTASKHWRQTTVSNMSLALSIHTDTHILHYTWWPKKVVHFPTHHIFGTVQNKLKRISPKCS